MTGSMVLDIVAKFGKGHVDTAQRTIDLYRPLTQDWILSGLNVTRDIAFGPHRLQTLDVYVPPKQFLGSPRPVVVFAHQGGFIAGDKTDLEAVNVGKFFADRGIVCVLTNYRLAPEGAWPAAVEDVAAATEWTRSNITSYGGDSARIVLFGHSSGATHFATYAMHKDFAKANPVWRGLILASGRYMLPPDDPDTNLFHNYGRPKIGDYFGNDRSGWKARQMVGNVTAPRFPVFFLLGENDNFMFEVNTINLIKEICDKSPNVMPRFVQIPDHNHISYYFHLGAHDDPIGDRLVDFVQTATTDGLLPPRSPVLPLHP